MKYFSLLVLLLSLASNSYSDDLNHDLKLVIGTSAFLDEEIPYDHFLAGASMRFGITKRFSIEPQFLYIKGPCCERDYTLTGNISYDLLTAPLYTVYAVAGAGLIRHVERFQSGDFSVNEWTVNGGLGVRLHITDRFFIAPEFRFGWEPLLSTQVGLGYSF
jgi:hypothetical protein